MFGLIVVDDEKALPAYLLGYGTEFRSEVRSHLSKRMNTKEFAEQEKKYFTSVIQNALEMNVDTVIIAGPGFTKDDIKKFADDAGLLKKSTKKIIYESASTAERSGIYELIMSGFVLKGLSLTNIARSEPEEEKATGK